MDDFERNNSSSSNQDDKGFAGADPNEQLQILAGGLSPGFKVSGNKAPSISGVDISDVDEVSSVSDATSMNNDKTGSGKGNSRMQRALKHKVKKATARTKKIEEMEAEIISMQKQITLCFSDQAKTVSKDQTFKLELDKRLKKVEYTAFVCETRTKPHAKNFTVPGAFRDAQLMTQQ